MIVSSGHCDSLRLRALPPFDRLTDDEFEEVTRALSPNSYAAGETVLERWRPAQHLFVVDDGLIEEQDTGGVIARYSTGNTFDYRAIVQGRSEHTFVARERSVCQLLPAPVLIALTRRNQAFRNHWQQEVARKADALIGVQQQREAASFLLSRIGDGELHSAVFVPGETSLQDAVSQMNSKGISYVLVRDGERVGIFTGRDVREKSLLMGIDGSTPVGALASYNLVTLDHDDFLFNALVLMTQYSIRHLVVTKGNDIVGVFEQADMLRHLTDSSFAIANRVERARVPAELESAGRSIPRLIETLHGRGIKPRYIARVVTNLNRKIFKRLFEQIVPEEIRAGACLIVMGSEGRAEQLLPTDQDNAVIFRDEPDPDQVTPPLTAFSDALINLGFPPCPGGIMVRNPSWAKSEASFRRDITRWLFEGKMEGFLNLAIFYDAAAVSGEPALLTRLKAHLFDLVKQEETALRYFARSILSFETPIGFLGRLITEKVAPNRGLIDLKKGGSFPLVHGVRSFALERRMVETNTIARIQLLKGEGLFSETMASDLIEAFDFVSNIRLRRQLDAWRSGRIPDNYIDPMQLNKLDRNLLRDSLKVVNELKSSVGYHFKLSLVS